MKNFFKISTNFLLITLISNSAYSQEVKIEKSINIDKNNLANEISAKSIENSIEQIFSPSKLKSIMHGDEEFNNIEKAVDAMRNNIDFIPEGEELSKKTQEDAVKREEELKKLESNEDNVKSYIYLSSIMFFGQNNWSAWVNDKKYTSSNNKETEEIFLKEISQDKIIILWKLSISKWKILSGKKSEELAPKINTNNQVEVEFTLKPNQTFILGSNKVVDGRAIDSFRRK
jgi:hypothetical protein